MPDCPPSYVERGSFRASDREVEYSIRPTEQRGAATFEGHVWTESRSVDKVAWHPEYPAVFAWVREQAWAELLK